MKSSNVLLTLFFGTTLAQYPGSGKASTSLKGSTYQYKHQNKTVAPGVNVLAKTGPQTYKAFPNGQLLYDTDGNQVQAYGGGFYEEDGWYYWVGQDMSVDYYGAEPSPRITNMYKSQDLMNWQYVSSPFNVYTKDVNGNQPLTYCMVQRAKLMKNPAGIHHRPGEGANYPAAMGDRIGQKVIAYNTWAINSSDTSHPYVIVQNSYPPQILQYNTPSLDTPLSYVSQSNGYGTAQVDNWWSYQLTDVRFNLTVKAIAIEMTPFDTSPWVEYSGQYQLSAASYIVRQPTSKRSPVAESVFIIGNPGTQRQALVSPVIGPTVNESTSKSVVYMNNGDAAFVTCDIDHTYWTGTRITISGTAGTNMTVKAVCALSGKVSPVVTQVYQIAANSSTVPLFRPIINFPSGTYFSNASAFGYESMKIYSPTYGTGLYYTMDGVDPNPANVGENIGYGTRDFTIYQDPSSGKGYMLSSTDNVMGRIWQLNDDWTDVNPEMEYEGWIGYALEAPAAMRHGGATGEYLYMLLSGQSGWYPNQAYYMRTHDPAAAFSFPRDPVTGYRDGSMSWSGPQPFGDASTYWSQPAYIMNLGTDAKPKYLYVGDHYNSVNLVSSGYVMLPAFIDDYEASEAGNMGTGNVTLRYTPTLHLNPANHAMSVHKGKLLSLNKPVTATPSLTLTAAQIAAGTYNYNASAANDGVDFDQNAYDTIQYAYMPAAVPYFWQVDLGAVYSLTWLGFSFMSVGGSDAGTRYWVYASVDGNTWSMIVDNSENQHPGYQSHMVSGSYRYVKLNVIEVHDVAHNKGASWEAALYEASVYGV